jgi:hypothetical protein
LNDRPRAIDAYRVAIESHGSSDELVDELSEMLAGEGRDAELAELYASEALRVTDKERRSDLYAALGDLERRRGNTRAALDAFGASLKTVPSSAKGQSGLETLIGSLSRTRQTRRSSSQPAFRPRPELSRRPATAGSRFARISSPPRTICRSASAARGKFEEAASVRARANDQAFDLRLSFRRRAVLCTRAEPRPLGQSRRISFPRSSRVTTSRLLSRATCWSLLPIGERFADAIDACASESRGLVEGSGRSPTGV